MNFRVERVTPGQIGDHGGVAVGRGLRAALPFTVEVEDSPEMRENYESICACKSIFRLTDDAVRGLKKHGLFRQDLAGRRNPCVCLCMGRVI